MRFTERLGQFALAKRSYINKTRSFKLETRSTPLTLFPSFVGFFAVTVFARTQSNITNLNILDLKQAARLLQMNPESLRRLAFRGAIPARKPGRKWLFLEEHLKEWLKGDYAASGKMAHKRKDSPNYWVNISSPGCKLAQKSTRTAKPETSTGVP